MSFTFSLQNLLPHSFNLKAQKDLDTVQQYVRGFVALNVVGFVDRFVLVECVMSLHSRPLKLITLSQCRVL